MAVALLTAEDIEVEVLRISGYRQSSRAPWRNSENLLGIMNRYGTRLATKLNGVARALGIVGPNDTVRFDMWRTVDDLAFSTGGGQQTGYLPADYDHYVSFWDSTNDRRIDPIQDVDKYHNYMKNKPSGPPEYAEILGFEVYGGKWRRAVKMHPATESEITPSVSVTYWRLPRDMRTLNDAPDCDPKYAMLWVYGTVQEVSRPADAQYVRYQELENTMLNELAATARAIH